MKALLKFEAGFFYRRVSFYAMLICFFLLGILTGSKANAFSQDGILKNAPFNLTYLLGYMSLICLFTSAILAARIIFREKDAGFAMILYTTPIKKINYLGSRFLLIFGITAFSFFTLLLGFMFGRQMEATAGNGYGPFHLWHYLQPFLLLGLPNAFFCSAIVFAAGIFSSNKLYVYISALFIYIFYMVALIFSGSPLMAGGFPPTPEAMELSAKLDPFGLSAFMKETLLWSTFQRNTQVVPLAGSLLFNRLLYMAISFAVLLITFKYFNFSVDTKKKRHVFLPLAKDKIEPISYKIIRPQLFDWRHTFASLKSFTKLDLTFVARSVACILILIGTGFMVSMEMYAEIEKGIRLPEKYASSGLMVNTIIDSFPFICLIVVVFYSNELVWRSRSAGFYMMENTAPVNPLIRFFSKWLSLNLIILSLTTWMILLGLVFQFAYGYTHIDWQVYAGLYFLVSLPLILSAGLLIAIQWLIPNKYFGLIISSLVVLLTSTSIGKLAGIRHPLIRVHAAFGGEYSDMNGWGAYLQAFGMKMIFGTAITLLMAIIISGFSVQRINFFKRLKPFNIVILLFLFCVALWSGVTIYKNVEIKNADAALQLQATTEKKYRAFQLQPQPVIADVKTTIDLYPDKNGYEVQAAYIIENKTTSSIHSLLIYVNPEMKFENIKIPGATLIEADKENGYYQFKLANALQPRQQSTMSFTLSYGWNGYNGHKSFNAIVGNGTFIRISRYFPVFGYQSGNEMEDENLRKQFGLGMPTAIKTLEMPRENDQDFIDLDMTISTTEDQQAIGIGELVRSWKKDKRNYFQYKTGMPVQFRFAVSSAKYSIKKMQHRGVTVEVFYDSKHPENVDHLMANACNTLDYCIANFGEYPFKTIRFAEVSSFTKGFAATAYPASIFMTEDMIFHANINGDKQQDVINELAGHELSHEWWGTNQFTTDDREGAAFLSETMAMYTELMLVKKMYGSKRVLENVRMHLGIYLSERGLVKEQPLVRSLSANAFQHYSKGMVVMYQLSEMIGEGKVNQCLRNLFQKYKYPAMPPIASDFLKELYAVTDTVFHKRIDELFKNITTYEFKIIKADYDNVKHQYTISADGAKFYEDGKGNKNPQIFNDSVDVALHFKNEKLEYLKLPVIKGKINAVIAAKEKPLQVEIDPLLKFIGEHQ